MTSALRYLRSISTLLLTLILSMPGMAQVFPEGNGISLSGLDRSDIYVNIIDWRDMNRDQGDFRTRIRQYMEEELAGSGIRRTSAGRHYLVCNLRAIGLDGPDAQVAYTAGVELWNLHSTGVHTLLWRDDQLGISRSAHFTTDRMGALCSEQFLVEWTRWNQ